MTQKFTLSYILQRIENTCIPKKIHTQLFLTSLFISFKKQKQPNCPSTDEWTKYDVFIPQNIIHD